MIDPQLIYCSYVGGSSTDMFFRSNVEIDNLGYIYTIGRTASSNFPTTPGAYSTTFQGDYDVFVIKLTPDASTIVFSTFIGGASHDIGRDLQLVGASNDIILTGSAGGNDFPTTPGVYQNTFAGGSHDVFIAKLNNAGNTLIFSTFVGGNDDDQPSDLFVNASQEIYSVGQTASSDFPTSAGTYQQSLGGQYDVYVFKMNSNGSNLQYSTFFGLSSQDRGTAVITDNASNIYISAYTEGNFITTAGCYDNTFNGGTSDIILSKFNPQLSSLIYSTYLGSPGEERAISNIFIDNSNNITLVGECGSGFPTTTGSYDQTYNGGLTDAFVAKMNSTGNGLIFSTLIGGSGNDYAKGLDIDATGDLLITGTAQNGFPTTMCPYDDTFNGGGNDAFVAKMDNNATSLSYSTYFGGSGDDQGIGITYSSDTILIIGETNSFNLPVTTNAYDQSFNGGNNDIFIVKLLPSTGSPAIANVGPDATICETDSYTFFNSLGYRIYIFTLDNLWFRHF